MISMGNIPPQAVDIEEAVLGELMIDRDAFNMVEDLFDPTMFYKDSNVKIANAIIRLRKKNSEIDMLTVAEELTTTGDLEKIGGPIVIAKMTQKISSAANIEEHVRILIDKLIKRSIIQIGSKYADRAYDNSEDSKNLIDDFQSKVLDIGIEYDSKKESKLSDLVEDVMIRLESKEEPTTFIKCHINGIMKSMNGFGKGSLTTIAARPSHGKSALTLDIACEIAESGIPTALFTLEMPEREIATRRLAAKSGIDVRLINSKKLNEAQRNLIRNAANDIFTSDAPLYIDDTAKLNINSCKSKIRRLVRNKDVRIVFIDYLQIMIGRKEFITNENRYYGDISKQLKELAMELDIPIILLSQLNRDVDKKSPDKQFPKLSDLRSTGELEQNSDNVIFITNFKMTGLKNFDGESTEGKNFVDCAKSRHGSPRSFIVRMSGNNLKYTDDKNQTLDGKDDLPF